MKRPELNEIPLEQVPDLIQKKITAITLDIDYWDELYQFAHDNGAVLIEVDKKQNVLRAFRRRKIKCPGRIANLSVEIDRFSGCENGKETMDEDQTF